MGIFDHIQKEVGAQDEREGITLADLFDLSPELRRLMNRITREGELTIETAADHLGEPPANARETLDGLVEKGYLKREARDEEWVYRTRFARKRGREIPAGIWSALDQRIRRE